VLPNNNEGHLFVCLWDAVSSFVLIIKNLGSIPAYIFILLVELDIRLHGIVFSSNERTCQDKKRILAEIFPLINNLFSEHIEACI